MTAAASHNGGKLQLNFNFLQTGGDYPFINLVKTGQFWGFRSGNVPVTPDLLDGNGYPTSILNSGYRTIFYVPTARDRPSSSGNTYVLTWTGNGTLTLGMSNTLVSGSKTGSGGVGRYVFTTTDFRFDVSITATPITSLACYHIDDEADYLAGNVFGAKFKQKIIEGGFGVLRFLNWTLNNTSNVTTWATRKPVSYAFYSDYELRSALYVTGMSNTGNAYSTSGVPTIHSSDATTWTAGDAPKDKDTVHVVFNASATQSGTCSIDIGASGSAVNILAHNAAALSAGNNTYPLASTFQSLATLVYDANLSAWLMYGGNLGFGPYGLINGVPVELCLQLCAEVGAHPHWCAPALSLTKMTDFTRQLAIYNRDNGPSWMVPSYEGPNELWNSGSAFAFFTTYASKVATSYGWTNDYHNWYGRIMSTMGQDIYSVYSNDKTKFRLLCGVQGGFGDTAPNRATHDPRMTSALYVLQSPQSGYAAVAAKNYITHICTAQYITPSYYSEATETTMAAAYGPKAFVASISGNTITTTSILSSSTTPLAVGDYVFGNSAFQSGNGTAVGTQVTSLSAQTTPQSITAITQANPAIVSVASPPPDGTQVYIAGAATHGMTQLADGWYTAKSPTGSTFQLFNMSAGAAINSSAFSAYSGSGATATRVGDYTINTSQTVASGQMTAASDQTQIDTYVDSLVSGGSHGVTLATANTAYIGWKSWAAAFIPSVKMCGYEGGFSPDFTGTNQVNRFRGASKNSSKLVIHTLTNLRNFKAAGGEFPSCFQLAGNSNINGTPFDDWSVLNDLYQTPDPPQWTAFKLFNDGKKRLIVKT